MWDALWEPQGLLVIIAINIALMLWATAKELGIMPRWPSRWPVREGWPTIIFGWCFFVGIPLVVMLVFLVWPD